jgi:hypothetical protein
MLRASGDEVDVAGAFAVAEEAAFDAVGAGHQAEFGGGDGRAAVVVRVEADDDAVAAGKVAVHPLDLVGVDVGGGDFDRGREVEDDLALRRGAPGGGDRIADFEGEIELGGGEEFRAVFEGDLGFRHRFGKGPDEPDGIDRHLHDLGLAHAEDVVAEGLAGGVIDVDDGLPRALERLEGAADEVFAGLGEHFDGDVVGDVAAFDEAAHEAEFGLRGRREGDLDFLEADGAERLEHAHLLLGVHRLEKRLVAVAQVGTHPDRRRRDDAVWPLTVGKADRREGGVFGRRVGDHGGLRKAISMRRF